MGMPRTYQPIKIRLVFQMRDLLMYADDVWLQTDGLPSFEPNFTQWLACSNRTPKKQGIAALKKTLRMSAAVP